MQMLRRIRMEQAQTLLTETRLPIKQIADMVGIPALDQFFRNFRFETVNRLRARIEQLARGSDIEGIAGSAGSVLAAEAKRE